MTRDAAVNMLMQEYGASEDYRPFFEDIVYSTCGDSRCVTAYTMEIIRQRLRDIT